MKIKCVKYMQSYIKIFQNATYLGRQGLKYNFKAGYSGSESLISFIYLPKSCMPSFLTGYSETLIGKFHVLCFSIECLPCA